jgi:hypothetical protein
MGHFRRFSCKKRALAITLLPGAREKRFTSPLVKPGGNDMLAKRKLAGMVFTMLLAAGLLGASAPLAAQENTGSAPLRTQVMEDGRTYVEVPTAVRDAFLAMMRGFMDALDDINAALAEGNFAEAARVARDKLGPAHEMIAMLQQAGVPDDKINEISRLVAKRMQRMIDVGGGEPGQMHKGMGMIVRQVLGDIPPALKERMMQRRMARAASGKAGGKMDPAGGFGQFGRYLPTEMRLMGMQMHVAGAGLAETAARVGDTPTVEDYQNVLTALGEVTGQCRACHAAWRVVK